MAKGIVYVMTNEGMPELVKVGRTKNLKSRRQVLYTTGVPFPFVVHHAVAVDDAAKVEQLVLEAFSDHRVNKRREFLEVAPEKVVAVMNLTGIAGKEVDENYVMRGQSGKQEKPQTTEITRDDIQASAKHAQRRPNFRFDWMKIPVDAILTFESRDDITAKVTGNKEVEYKERKMTLSKAAESVFTDVFKKPGPRSGLWHWKYDGEILNERRNRMEREGE